MGAVLEDVSIAAVVVGALLTQAFVSASRSRRTFSAKRR
jgi:hypothetical protein